MLSAPALSGLLAAGFADRFDRKRFLLFFYCRLLGRYRAVRAGAQLSVAPRCPHRDRTVRRRDWLDRSCDRHRPVPASDAGSRDGHRTDGIFREPGSGNSRRASTSPISGTGTSTFLAIILVATPVGLIIVFYMKPVSGHLALKQQENPWGHLTRTIFDAEIPAGVRHHGIAGRPAGICSCRSAAFTP